MKQLQRTIHHRKPQHEEVADLPETLDVSEVLRLADLAIEHIDEVIE